MRVCYNFDMMKEEVRKKNEKSLNEEIRLNKFLSDAGFCSRREADRLIGQGKVLVNGDKAAMGQKVTLNDHVCVDGQRIKREEERILIAFNKPMGVECTSDLKNPDNIIDYIGYPKRIYPIGRLDKNSQGLMLLTNDGALVNNILKASNYHEKEYIVTVDKPITEEFIKKMSFGVQITIDEHAAGKKGCGEKLQRQTTRPCRVIKLNKHTFDIILTQGLNRQIRRMCAALGYHVQKLKRIRIMNIELGNLPKGTYRDVSDDELQKLVKSFEKKNAAIHIEENSK